MYERMVILIKEGFMIYANYFVPHKLGTEVQIAVFSK